MSFLFHMCVSSNLTCELILHFCRRRTEWRLQPSTPSCLAAPHSTSHSPLLNIFITCVSMTCVQACTWLCGHMEVTSQLWDVCSLLPPLIGFQDFTLILKLVLCGKRSLYLLAPFLSVYLLPLLRSLERARISILHTFQSQHPAQHLPHSNAN